ncbi:hypothetical protein [Haladaptatus halobius]|uniref:hypothetical protein n=1 Tax=Haladaptatus halobius TaxID=2884875 RepID=UPI001D0A0A42|nr:hypothetical protein [Haladaptatus halobius]
MISRRTYLKLTGAIATSSAAVGTASAEHSGYEDQYNEVIDVTEVGADNSGNESITPVLEEHAADDTLLYFPEGRYYMDSQFRHTGFTNFGMVGHDAELVPASYNNFDDGGDGNYRLFRLGVEDDPGTDLRVEGFTVDQTKEKTGTRVVEAEVTDGLLIRDIDIVGYHDSGTFGPLRAVVSTEDGSGLVERFKAPDGGAWTGETPSDSLWRGPTGILSNEANKGTITFRNCVLGSFPDNGLYAADGSGSIQIEGGRFENSLGANVRLGGNDSYIKNATIVVNQQDDNGIAQRGLRIEGGVGYVVQNVDFETNIDKSPAIWITSNANDVTIVNSTVTVRTDGPSPAISIRGSAGQTQIKQTTVDHETGGGPAIKIKEGDKPVSLEHVTVIGNAPTDGTRSAIQNYRNGSEFRNLKVDHGGGEGRRALTNTGNNVVIYEGDYVSEENAIVESGSGTLIESVSALARSGNEGLRITSDAEDVTVKDSHIANGINDESPDGYDGGNNSWEYDGGDKNDGDTGSSGTDGNTGGDENGGNSGDDSTSDGSNDDSTSDGSDDENKESNESENDSSNGSYCPWR